MATCKNCKAELTEGYDFCLACGMPVPTDIAVPNLGERPEPEVLPPPPPAEQPPFMPPPPPAGRESPPPYAGGGLRAEDERTWSMAAHLSAFVQLVGIPSVVGPLVVWLIKKDSSPMVDAHGKEAVNFNISIMLYGVISFLLLFVLIGFLLLPVIGVAWFVLVLVATAKATNNEFYRYPLTIRFIK